jgi:hypothetical protein
MKIERTVSSIQDFLKHISDIRGEWPRKAWKELWFRGEGRDYKENRLRPALYRSSKVGALRSAIDLIEIEDDLFQHFQHNATELAKEESLGKTLMTRGEATFSCSITVPLRGFSIGLMVH